MNRIGCRRPSTSFQARPRSFRIARQRAVLILAAFATIYISLGMLYEVSSIRWTILSTLPSARRRRVLALLLFRTEFDIIGMIGVILLIGIVKKNAIMMIDFALDAERLHGMSPADAIREACLLRFRPIMMTTMASLLGAVPLIIGMGEGKRIRRPLGITIIGGLVLSQILTCTPRPSSISISIASGTGAASGGRRADGGRGCRCAGTDGGSKPSLFLGRMPNAYLR